MQEKHPIDERFHALLHDAEAAPPERVHTALAGRMGWNARTAGASSLPFLMVGFLGVALALANWGHRGPQAQQASVVHAPTGSGTATGDGPSAPVDKATAPFSLAERTDPVVAPSQQEPNESQAPAYGAEVTGPTRSLAPRREAAPRQPGHASAAPVAAATSPTPSGTRPSSTHIAAPKQGARPDGIPDMADHAQASTAPGTFAEPPTPPLYTVAPGDATPQGEDTSHNMNSPIPKTATGTDTDVALPPTPPLNLVAMEEAALERLSPIVRSGGITPALPLAAAPSEAYVLPRGEWWWSIGAGVSRTSATWVGDGADVSARAEQWRGGHQLGVGVGRSWRNGLGVGVGLNMERLRSDFQHEAHTPGAAYAELDTAWTTLNYPGTGDPVSIWSIDSATVVGPGSWERTSGRNTYTVLHVPITAWWHTDVRRWSFGATAGVMGLVTVQREGHTLARNATDGTWKMTALTDPGTNDRFRPQLHGMAGLSIGYLLSEHLRILAEPMYATPLSVPPGAPSVSLSRTTFQIRLQHALHCR